MPVMVVRLARTGALNIWASLRHAPIWKGASVHTRGHLQSQASFADDSPQGPARLLPTLLLLNCKPGKAVLETLVPVRTRMGERTWTGPRSGPDGDPRKYLLTTYDDGPDVLAPT